MNWIEILSYIFNGILLAWAVTERFLSAQDKASIKSSIRVWQNQSKGITSAVRKLSWAALKKDGDPIFETFSDKKDVGIALDALSEAVESMTQSLYESRFFTEEELKENIKKDDTEHLRLKKSLTKKIQRKFSGK